MQHFLWFAVVAAGVTQNLRPHVLPRLLLLQLQCNPHISLCFRVASPWCKQNSFIPVGKHCFASVSVSQGVRDLVGAHKWQVHFPLWYHFTFWLINTFPFHRLPAKEVTERLFHCEQLAGHMAKSCQTGKERQVPQGLGLMLSVWVNWWLTGVENGAHLFLSDLNQVFLYLVALFSYLRKQGDYQDVLCKSSQTLRMKRPGKGY